MHESDKTGGATRKSMPPSALVRESTATVSFSLLFINCARAAPGDLTRELGNSSDYGTFLKRGRGAALRLLSRKANWWTLKC